MAEIDEEIRKAIEGLKTLTGQLESGQLKLLFARAGDAEWADGAANMTRYYKQLQMLLEAIRASRVKQRRARLRRRKERQGRQGGGAAPRKLS